MEKQNEESDQQKQPVRRGRNRQRNQAGGIPMQNRRFGTHFCQRCSDLLPFDSVSLCGSAYQFRVFIDKIGVLKIN